MTKPRSIVYKGKKYTKIGLFSGYEDNYTLPGKFLGIGVDYQEFEEGPGNFSTAIIEIPNGEVLNIPIELIKFTDNG